MASLAAESIVRNGDAPDTRARLADLERALADEIRKSETLARVNEALASSNEIPGYGSANYAIGMEWHF